jgi:hypothetical protein
MQKGEEQVDLTTVPDETDEEEEVIVIGSESEDVQTDEEEPEGPTYQERYEKLRKYVFSNPPHREINYKILKHCREACPLRDLETHVAAYPEFKKARQSEYFLIKWLVDHGGLEELEIDEEGAVILSEQKEGLTEDEIDDLVVDFAFLTTDVGLDIVEELDPQHRLIELLEIEPRHYDTYIEVLEFLQEPRGFAKVDTLLRGRDVLWIGRGKLSQAMQPSVFVDRLERAGGVFWDEGWMLTPEGKELLETIKERVED